MPEEAIINEEKNQITYNVVLDTSDISRQAEEIRNQLDLALGVGSNAGTQFINTTDFINPQFGPLLPPSMVGMEGQFGGTLDGDFWKKTQDRMIDVFENLVAGLERVREDISMLVNRESTIIQGSQPIPTSQNPFESLLPDTFGEKVLASLGFGGDIAGPIAPSKYQKYGENILKEEIRDIFQNPGETLNELTSTPLGMALSIGALFTPAAPYVIATELAAMGDELLSGAYNQREDLAEGIQEIALQQFGKISKEESRGMAQDVVDYVNSFEGYTKDYDIDEVSQNILQFANMGGFSKVGGADELKEKLSAVVEDTRQIARNLGIFQEEAINIMAELEQKSMVNVESMREMSDKMRFYGSMLKQSPTELLGGAVQSAEQFRQAGMYTAPEVAMQNYIDANLETQQLINSTDPYIQSSIYRMGGAAGTTQSLLNAYSQYQSSTLGDMTTMAQFLDPDVGGDIDAVIDAMGGYLGVDEMSLFYGRGKEKVQKERTLKQSAYDMIQSAVTLYTRLEPGKPPTPENIEGFMQMPSVKGLFNLTPDQGRIAVEMVMQDIKSMLRGENPEEKMERGEIFSGIEIAKEETETTFFGKLFSGVIKETNDFWSAISIDYGEKKAGIVDRFMKMFSSDVTLDDYGKTEQGAGYDVWDFLAFSITKQMPMPDLDPDDYSVIPEFKNPFVREQIRAGRHGIVGRAVEESYRQDLIDGGLDEVEDKEEIDIKLNALWGIDSSVTEDEKYALNMWRQDRIVSPVEHQYYTDAIEDMENLMTDKKGNPILDKNGDPISLEDMVRNIDTKTLEVGPSFIRDMSEEKRHQLIYQALDDQQDPEIEEKVISFAEARSIGTRTLDLLETGTEIRKEKLKERTREVKEDVESESEILMAIFREDETINKLAPPIEMGIENAFNQAVLEMKSFKGVDPETGKEIDADEHFMNRVQKIYDTQFRPAGAGGFLESELDDQVRKISYTGVGGEVRERFMDAIEIKGLIVPFTKVFEIVDAKRDSVLRETGRSLNTTEIANAVAEMTPVLLGSNIELDLSKLDAAGFVAFEDLINNIKLGSKLDAEAYTDQLRTISEQMNIPGLEDALTPFVGEIGKKLHDADIGENTEKIKTATERTAIALEVSLGQNELNVFQERLKSPGIEG